MTSATMTNVPHRTRHTALGLYLFFVVLSPGWLVSHDASARLVIARQLWQSGTVFIQGTRPERFVETPLGSTTYFGIGQSLVFIPFDMLGYALGKLVPEDSPLNGHVQVLPLLFLYAPLVGMLWWLITAKVFQMLGWQKDSANRAAFLGLVSSIALVYVTQSLQEEAILGVLISATLYALLCWLRDGKPIQAQSIGFFLGLALVFRLNTIFALLPLAGLAIDTLRRRKNSNLSLMSLLRNASAASLLPISLILIFNYWRFGSPFLTGHSRHYSQLAALGIEVWRPVQLKMAFDLLFGAGKGLFVVSPPLILAGIGFFSSFRKQFYYHWGLLFALAGSALFYSKLNGFACGGHCWGARFQVHLLPLFIPAIHNGWSLLKTHFVGKCEVGALLALGILFQLAAISAPESLEYAQEIGRLGDYREELITQNRYGHLPLRLHNLLDWVRHNPLSAHPNVERVIKKLEDHHMPNVWGYSYASYAASKTMRCVILGFWGALLVGAVIFLVNGLAQRNKLRPTFSFSKRILDT